MWLLTGWQRFIAIDSVYKGVEIETFVSFKIDEFMELDMCIK